METEALGLGEHCHRIGNMVQGLVMGLDIALQGLAQFLCLRDIIGPDPDAAAIQRLSCDTQCPATPTQRHPPQRLTCLAQIGGLAGECIGSLVKGSAALAGLIKARGAHRAQPCSIDPNRVAVGGGNPSGPCSGIQQGSKARRGRQAGILANHRR